MASFIDYDNLCETIASWLARDDLTEEIKNFVWLAECDIQRTIRFRDPQDSIYESTTVEDQEWVELPEDYAEGGHLRWDNSNKTLPQLEVSSIAALDQLSIQKASTWFGREQRVAFLWGNRLYMGPVPGAEPFTLYYKSGVVHLSSKTSTNLILREYPDCLLYGSLATSAPFLGADERLGMWVQLYDNAKEETRKAEWRARTGHGLLRMRTDTKVF